MVSPRQFLTGMKIIVLRWLVFVAPFIVMMYVASSIINMVFWSPFQLGHGESCITPAIQIEILVHAFTTVQLPAIIIMIVIGLIGGVVIVKRTEAPFNW